MLPKLKDIYKAKPSFIKESYNVVLFLLNRLKPILLLIICIIIIIVNANGVRSEQFRIAGMEFTSSLYSVINKPIEFFNEFILNINQALNAHNIVPYLRAENQDLRVKIELYKDMEHENKRLRHLLQFANHSIYSPIAAKVVSESFNGSKSRFLINAGSSSGISEGMPVLNEHGLIGRVVEVSEDSARVMALQDEQSNIPAIIKQVNKRCIVSGGGALNKSEIKIKYLKEDDIEEGMDALTSGDGGLLPKNLHIGSVSKNKGFVTPSFKLEDLDYVLILKSRQ